MHWQTLKKSHIWIFCVMVVSSFAVCSSSTASAEPVTLTYQVSRHVEQRPKQDLNNADKNEAAPTDLTNALPETIERRITLAPEHVVVDDDKSTTVYDFVKEKRYSINKQQMTYLETSIYAIAGSHLQQMKNRLRLLQSAKESHANSPFGDETELENSLGVVDSSIQKDRDIQTKKENDCLTFEHNGRLLAKFCPGEPVPAELRQSWRRYLANCCAMHPLIRQKILENGNFQRRCPMLQTARAVDLIPI
jgi:hypothetical protein